MQKGTSLQYAGRGELRLVSCSMPLHSFSFSLEVISKLDIQLFPFFDSLHSTCLLLHWSMSLF